VRDRHLSLHELQARAARGDAGAVRELRRRLKPILACIVRRTLCLPREGSWLQDLVQAEIHRIWKRDFDAKMADDRRLVAQIVTRIDETVMDRLRAGLCPASTSLETVRDWSWFLLSDSNGS
jgi:hypothetical protein